MVFETIAFASFAIRAQHDAVETKEPIQAMNRRRTRVLVAAALLVGGLKAYRDFAVARNRARAAHLLGPASGTVRPPGSAAP